MPTNSWFKHPDEIQSNANTGGKKSDDIMAGSYRFPLADHTASRLKNALQPSLLAASGPCVSLCWQRAESWWPSSGCYLLTPSSVWVSSLMLQLNSLMLQLNSLQLTSLTSDWSLFPLHAEHCDNTSGPCNTCEQHRRHPLLNNVLPCTCVYPNRCFITYFNM